MIQKNHYYLQENQMDPKSIEWTNLTKIFEYEKMSRDLDECADVETLRNICKCYVKLYFKQQETLSCIGLGQFKDE